MANTVDKPSPAQEAGRSLKSATEEQLQGAKSALRETGADLSDKAGELAGDAKEAVVRKAEDVKQGLSGGLQALGGAMRAAGDHLSEKGQPGSSRLLDEAASGVERFAQSLENRSLGEILEELRDLGRNNAGGLFAGSLLAGLALGRVLKATDGGDSARRPSADGQGSASPAGPARTQGPTPTAAGGDAP